MAGGLTRWDPLAEITELRSRFDRLLDELGEQDHGAWMPAIDLVRHDDDLVVRMDLPGIRSGTHHQECLSATESEIVRGYVQPAARSSRHTNSLLLRYFSWRHPVQSGCIAPRRSGVRVPLAP
jgi:hypothetical protein